MLIRLLVMGVCSLCVMLVLKWCLCFSVFFSWVSWLFSVVIIGCSFGGSGVRLIGL